MIIIILLAFSFFLSSLFIIKDSKKVYENPSLNEDSKLLRKEKNNLNKFLIASTALVLSGIFFSNIDRIMLGYFVDAEFIGFYSAGIGLIGAAASIIAFAPIAFFPIFSRLKGNQLKESLKKSERVTFLISLLTLIFTLALAYFIVLIIYGADYLPSVNLLRIFSILVIFLPLTGLYQSYLLSQNKPRTVAKLLIFSTGLNIILNYFLISGLLNYGQMAGVYGAVIATIISNGFYLVLLRTKIKRIILKKEIKI